MQDRVNRIVKHAGLAALIVAAAIAAYWGWRLFLFLTDDAYIAFRYVSNSRMGWGWVWNPPAFHPVEGYTSFLWVVLLRVVWDIFDVAPPVASNWLSLGFGYGTLAVVFLFLFRMKLAPSQQRYRVLFLALALTGILTNRTFAAWLSSGLETALFNFLVVWWLYEATTAREARTSAWVLRLSASASLIALTRPDGLPFLAVTVTALLIHKIASVSRTREGTAITWHVITRPLGLSRFSFLFLSPFLVVLIHLIWRRAFYGHWMPNTYYAKVGHAWPEAGLRYGASFIVEYAVYIWFLIGAAVVVVKARNRLNQKERIDWLDVVETALPLTPILFHIFYYVFIVGGDHFEYRVFSYLVPLIWISAVKLLAGLLRFPAAVSACLAVFIFLSWPIPWVHWSVTHNLNTRQETSMMRRPIADRFPSLVRPMIEQWDRWQIWLIEHHVCMRHQEHKIFHEFQTNRYPSRKEGLALNPQGPFPVLVMGSVGVIGWILPTVSIIDLFGLNDRVVAHRKHRGFQTRHMGHDLRPPPGYTECFEPNVIISTSPPGMPNPPKSTIRVMRRKRPLTPERIRACEDKFFGGW